MNRGNRTRTALVALAAPLLAGAPARAAEEPVGSAARPGVSQFDDVPGLWAGTTAPGQEVEDGGVSVEVGPGRCQATATLGASLVARGDATGRRLGRRRIRLRGAGRRTLTLTARRVDRGGIDPTSVATLSGRLPRDVVPAEPRRTVQLSFTVTAEEEGCLRSVSRDAARLLPTLYLRQERGARPRIAPLHSPTRRLDGGAPARIGGPLPGAALGASIDPAGDVDGDGRDDVLLQQGELSEDGARFRGLVRFGGELGAAGQPRLRAVRVRDSRCARGNRVRVGVRAGRQLPGSRPRGARRHRPAQGRERPARAPRSHRGWSFPAAATAAS